ncbi:30S ribosomal protein S19 [uncultured archaeon]|nr:30S ribosomal protein S19 [uncultured archaeon]
MARKFIFRGKSLEELQALSTEEFLKLIDSRARRYVNRMPVDYKRLLDKVRKVGEKKEIRTTIREAVIIPQWVGLKFKIHGGKEFKLVTIQPDMVGRRLGDFVHTTGRVLHSGPGVGATRGSKFLPLK